MEDGRGLGTGRGQAGHPTTELFAPSHGARFDRLGFPTTRDEAWRQTSVAPLSRTRFDHATRGAIDDDRLPARGDGRVEVLGLDPFTVVKTLVMEDDARRPLLMLMHGDREVSTKNLARTLGVKMVMPCEPAVADRHSGYQVGGTSPFGTRRAMPVYMQRTIADLPYLYVNGGRRGYLVGMAPADLVRVLRPAPVDAMA